jgi:hypothetical protein
MLLSDDIGIASNGLLSIQNFVKVSHLVQKVGHMQIEGAVISYRVKEGQIMKNWYIHWNV